MAIERDEPVMVCDGCGCGFLRMPRGGIHVHPVWGWTETIKADGMCLGTVVTANRQIQIRNLDNWELNDVKDRP